MKKYTALYFITSFFLLSYWLLSIQPLFAESKLEQNEIQTLAQVSYYYNLGLKYEEEGKLGNALIEFRKALSTVPNYKDAYSRVKNLEKRIRSKIAYRVAILPFKNFTSDTSIADSFCEALTKSLMQRSASLVIIERNELDKILAEHKLGLQDIISPDTTVPVGKIKGINAFILGKILNYQVDTIQTVENLTKRYQAGSRQEINPEYIKLYQEYQMAKEDDAVLDQLRMQYEMEDRYHQQMADMYQQRADYLSNLANKQSGLDSIETRTRAADEVMKSASHIGQSIGTSLAKVGIGFAQALSVFQNADIKKKLSETPPTIQVPVYKNWHYTIRHVKKEAIMEVSCKIIDIATGVVCFSDRITNKSIDEDDTVENANEAIGIYSDPLEISSDSELKSKVLEETVSEIAEKIIKALQDYGSSYYFLGKSMEMTNPEEAIEHYVEFLLSGYPFVDDKIREATNFILKKKGYKWEISITENEVLQKLF